MGIWVWVHGCIYIYMGLAKTSDAGSGPRGDRWRRWRKLVAQTRRRRQQGRRGGWTTINVYKAATATQLKRQDALAGWNRRLWNEWNWSSQNTTSAFPKDSSWVGWWWCDGSDLGGSGVYFGKGVWVKWIRRPRLVGAPSLFFFFWGWSWGIRFDG